MLTLGSPTLAAYSACVTVLNRRWIRRRFKLVSYPNAHRALQVLCSLQQAPVHVNTDDCLLASLVVLPQNDEWWKELLRCLDMNYVNTWSFCNVSSIVWVVVAFLLTMMDGFASESTIIQR
jgi:hypothetical protein